MKAKISIDDISILFPDVYDIKNMPRKMKKEFKKNIVKRFHIEFEKWQEDPEKWKNEFLNK